MAPVLFVAGENDAVYEVVPSLVQISAVKIVIILWNRADVRTMIRQDGWVYAEEKVRDYAQLLLLTEQTKAIVLNFTKIIGGEIFNWMNCYGNFTLPKHLYWTAFGSLDKTKTAHALVSDPALDSCYRYALAYTFCFESNIIELWNQLPDHPEEDSCISFERFVLTTIWRSAMKTRGTFENSFEKLWSDTTFRVRMESPRCYTKAAVEYFLPKLSLPVREEFLARVVRLCITENNHTLPNDLVFFLLSQTDTDQRAFYLKKCSHLVLIRCLVWPRQTVFMPVAKLLEPFLSDSMCMDVFNGIIKKFFVRAKYCNYRQLFTEFWEQSPETRKRYVMQELASGCDLLYKLFTAEDRDNITLILQYASAEEQEKIVSFYREYCNAADFSDDLFLRAMHEKEKRKFLKYLLKEVHKKSC